MEVSTKELQRKIATKNDEKNERILVKSKRKKNERKNNKEFPNRKAKKKVNDEK